MTKTTAANNSSTNLTIKELWVEKYRPTQLKDYILNSETKQRFKDMIKNKSLVSCTFAGCQGSGKTTLAKILCNEFDAEVLFVPCATEGTLDILRTKITEFCNAMSIDGRLKIVILDEVDSASNSGSNNFQLALRNLIEKAQTDTRFILTCNLANKVFPAILSRCPLVTLKFDIKDLLLYIKKILDAEKIEYDKASLKLFVETAFKYHPDCRRIINYLQFCCNSGKLVVNSNAIADSEKENFISALVKMDLEEDNLLNVRKFYLREKDKLGDFLEAGSALFNYVADNGLVTSDGLLRLADMLYALNVVVDKEPTYFGMLVAIRKYKA